jgi:hypothetical protein
MEISYFLIDKPVMRPVFRKFSRKCDEIVSNISFVSDLLNTLPGQFELHYHPGTNGVCSMYYGGSVVHRNLIKDILPVLTSGVKNEIQLNKELVKEIPGLRKEEFSLIAS